MATFDDMMVDNPNLREQYDTWREEAVQAGGDPTDWNEFRSHLSRLGAPDPGERPPDDFVGEDFKEANPEWVARYYG